MCTTDVIHTPFINNNSGRDRQREKETRRSTCQTNNGTVI